MNAQDVVLHLESHCTGYPPAREPRHVRVLVACEYSGTVRDAFRARVHRMAPGPDRWKERSRTLPGIARAMAEQWGLTP